MKVSKKRPGLPGLVAIPFLLLPPAETVPRMESASAQLAHAASRRTAMRGKAGEELEAARKAAVEAYRAVREHFAGESRACAEASFRAGELLRAASDAGAAIREFEIARERGAETPFRVRAMLEIGHVHRRSGAAGEALASYESALADPGATPSQRDDASHWIGQVHQSAGRIEDARRAWKRVAEQAEDPLDRIRAWDCLALTFVASGDLEGGAGVVERCREALAEIAAEETRLGERVRDALSTLRALDELQRAVQERSRREEAEKKSAAGSSFEPRR